MRILLLFTVLVLATWLPAPSHAQDIAEQPCDPQYWRQLSARAWLESEREIMQNQNLIFRPDSVLQYVCFDQFMGITAEKGGNIFVHTKYFSTEEIIKRDQPEGMDLALTAVVGEALSAYQQKQFKNQGESKDFVFLGGRADKMSTASSDYKLESDAKKHNNYTCQNMSHVWKAAKCANFVDNHHFADTDGFYPFDAIKGHGSGKDVAGYKDDIVETRKWPKDMDCSGGSGAGPSSAGASKDQGAAGTWGDQLRLAENEDNNLYKFQEPLGKIFKEVGKKLKPGECSTDTQGIKTGVKVMIDGKESHDDGVCTNPGCTYTKSGKCSSGGS